MTDSDERSSSSRAAVTLDPVRTERSTVLRRFVARTLEATSELVFALSMAIGDAAEVIGAPCEIDEQLDEVVQEWAADG